ncbi:MAG: beta-hydroxyacyl-ACP dehydratase [Gemmataceae bacterium]|nr:beta-hydroxyacyl-ACP dehydratase [Gemmataceae bacterium]
MPPEAIFDFSKLDFNTLVADKETIRKSNLQRHEMEHLDGVVYIDSEAHIFVGYKDVRADEFWVRGHMPGFPILPAVLMCEAAAQMCSYYIERVGLNSGDFVGFFGLDNARFRSMVKPGDRLVMVAKPVKLHRRQTIFNVQGFVGDTMAFHCDVIGVPLKMNLGESVKS